MFDRTLTSQGKHQCLIAHLYFNNFSCYLTWFIRP